MKVRKEEMITCLWQVIAASACHTAVSSLIADDEYPNIRINGRRRLFGFTKFLSQPKICGKNLRLTNLYYREKFYKPSTEFAMISTSTYFSNFPYKQCNVTLL